MMYQSGMSGWMRAIGLAASLVLGLSTPSRVLAAELVASFPFESDARDGSGNGYHGILNGAVAALNRDGESAEAFRFDGIDDFIQIADAPGLNPTTGIVVEAWILPEALGGPEPSDQILMKENRYQLLIGPDSVLSFGIGPHPWTHAFDTGTVALGTWTHVRGVYDFKSGMLALFVNGERRGTAYRPMPEWAGMPGGIFIGMNPSAMTGYHFEGSIDDVRLWTPCHDRLGDYNCDGYEDAVDLALLIDRVFFGGNPATPCTVDPLGP